MGRRSPPATTEQKIEFVSLFPSPLASHPRLFSPSSCLPAPLCLVYRWGLRFVALSGCLVPRHRAGLPQHAALEGRQEAWKPFLPPPAPSSPHHTYIVLMEADLGPFVPCNIQVSRSFSGFARNAA
jgi:hypothetical protein